jgi:hypothetical protein
VIATTILKCILLAKTHVLVLEAPINEYAMATITKTYNEVNFEATVIEGRLNSVMIEYPAHGVKTMSYSIKDYEQRSLVTNLDFKNEHASLDCEINDQPIPQVSN